MFILPVNKSIALLFSITLSTCLVSGSSLGNPYPSTTKTTEQPPPQSTTTEIDQSTTSRYKPFSRKALWAELTTPNEGMELKNQCHSLDSNNDDADCNESCRVVCDNPEKGSECLTFCQKYLTVEVFPNAFRPSNVVAIEDKIRREFDRNAYDIAINRLSELTDVELYGDEYAKNKMALITEETNRITDIKALAIEIIGLNFNSNGLNVIGNKEVEISSKEDKLPAEYLKIFRRTLKQFDKDTYGIGETTTQCMLTLNAIVQEHRSFESSLFTPSANSNSGQRNVKVDSFHFWRAMSSDEDEQYFRPLPKRQENSEGAEWFSDHDSLKLLSHLTEYTCLSRSSDKDKYPYLHPLSKKSIETFLPTKKSFYTNEDMQSKCVRRTINKFKAANLFKEDHQFSSALGSGYLGYLQYRKADRGAWDDMNSPIKWLTDNPGYEINKVFFEEPENQAESFNRKEIIAQLKSSSLQINEDASDETKGERGFRTFNIDWLDMRFFIQYAILEKALYDKSTVAQQNKMKIKKKKAFLKSRAIEVCNAITAD